MKKTVFLFFTLFVLQIVCAQTLPKEFGKYRRTVEPEPSATPIIDNAVANGIFIIVQSYQLEDSVGKFFGIGGKKEFGSDTNIAIKVKDGYLLFDQSRKPWDYNPSFKKFRKRFTPILFPTQYTEMSDQPKYDSIPYLECKLSTIFPNELYAMPTNVFFNDGFSTGHSDGPNDGFLVWITKPIDKNIDDNSKLNLITVPTTIEETNNRGLLYDIPNISIQDDIMGVIYVVPENTGIGRIDFILHGIGVLNDGSWSLICPFSEINSVFQSETMIEIIDREDDVILTPNN